MRTCKFELVISLIPSQMTIFLLVYIVLINQSTYICVVLNGDFYVNPTWVRDV